MILSVKISTLKDSVMPKEWNIEEAVAMWNKGSTALQIAQHFGKSRNSVIGYIKRARDKGELYVALKPSFKKSNKTKKEEPKLPPFKPQVSLQIVKGTGTMDKGLTIYNLKPGQCKYAVGYNEAGHYVFCGEPTNRNYCDMHHALCHTRVEPKKKVGSNYDPKRKFMHYR